MRARCLAVAAAISIGAVSSGTRAATVTWEFQAVVRGTAGTPVPFPGTDSFIFFEGQVLHGSLSFESSTPDSVPSGGLVGLYDGAVGAISIDYLSNFGEPFPPGPFPLPVSAVPGASAIDVTNAPPLLGAVDRLRARSDLQAAPGSLTTIRAFELGLLGLGPELWSTDALPLVPPSLSLLAPFDPAWDTQVFRTGVFLSSADNGYRVGAELTMLQAVPEPLAVPLLALALLALSRSVYAVACCFAQR